MTMRRKRTKRRRFKRNKISINHHNLLPDAESNPVITAVAYTKKSNTCYSQPLNAARFGWRWRTVGIAWTSEKLKRIFFSLKSIFSPRFAENSFDAFFMSINFICKLIRDVPRWNIFLTVQSFYWLKLTFAQQIEKSIWSFVDDTKSFRFIEAYSDGKLLKLSLVSSHPQLRLKARHAKKALHRNLWKKTWWSLTL